MTALPSTLARVVFSFVHEDATRFLLASGLQDAVSVLVRLEPDDDGLRLAGRARSRSVRTLNANSVRLSFRQFHRCGEALPHDCLGVSPIFGGDFCYPVDPQVVSPRLNFDVVDAVFHFALCACYLLDISGGVGQSVALAVDGHLHLV